MQRKMVVNVQNQPSRVQLEMHKTLNIAKCRQFESQKMFKGVNMHTCITLRQAKKYNFENSEMRGAGGEGEQGERERE